MTTGGLVDFTSALYLGLVHESEALRWRRLTTGTPAALRAPPGSAEVEARFAALVGGARAVALASTLHAFWDLFGPTCDAGAVLYDAGAYPIARWGMVRAERRGLRTIRFAHHDPGALRAALARLGGRARPWVVTDSICLGCARTAPLRDYARLVAEWDGLMIVDDAHGVGLLGRAPAPRAALGSGGGGALRHDALAGLPVVVVASLAKALGVPLALLAGAAPFVERFRASSDTLVHCSPPSAAHLAAAARALALNATVGERLRARLAARVRAFRRALRARGIDARGGALPFQRVRVADAATALRLCDALAAHGVRALVHHARCTDEVALGFCITARHDEGELHQAAEALSAVLAAGPEGPFTSPAMEA